MSNFPAYSFQPQQINNPYQGNYQTMQSPYMAQMGQYQPQIQSQAQPQQQSQGLVCKPVSDASNVSPNDVPMDGNAAVFPKNDFSEIYVKSWTSNGTIQTVVYKPVQPENASEGTNIPQMDFNALNDGIMALGNNIMDRIDKLEKALNNSSSKTAKNSTRVKKEVNADE